MSIIDEKKINVVEEQIEREKKNVDYDTREFTIEILVKKYLEGEDDDQNEIYVPEYQKELVWDEYRQSRLIESIILGLPIPLIFVAVIPEIHRRLQIVDGSQRIKTLARFLTNELCLKGLTVLENLNGFSFEDLSTFRQRQFKNTPMRIIVLSKTTEAIRHDIFDRLNPCRVPPGSRKKRKIPARGKFCYQQVNSSIDSLPVVQKPTQPLLFP